MMPEWLRAVLGEVTWAEVALVAFWSVSIVLYRHVPRVGELLGGLLERRR
jgi:hypothetical protein